jgi:geranylgeranyl pyrophosphate synthase
MPRVESRMRAQADHYHPELGAAIEHLLSSGGKRVRPATALLMGEMLGADTERLIMLGSSIELMHTATLVHDDLIDGSLMRRGIETLNAQWTPAATVLTGDFIFAIAAREAAETESPDVIRLFAETLAIIVSGEINQLFVSHGLASRENYFQRIYAKTASMFVLATGAAAMLSPADPDVISLARDFGYEIGMAFQIVDDVLDFTGQQETIGKPVASDLRQGLVTLPALEYYEQNPNDADMQVILAGKGYSETVIVRLVDSIRKSGAIQQALDEAKGFIDRATVILSTFPSGPEHDALEELAGYFLNRLS